MRWVCTVRGETNSRVAMSLLASPSLTSRTTSRSVGVSEAQPLVGRLRFAATALCVGDRFVGGQRGALGPRGFKVLLAQRITKRRRSGIQRMASKILNRTRPPRCRMDVCGAEQPRRFRVTAGADGECGEALESVRSGAVCPGAGGGRECVVRVAVGLFGLTLRDPRRRRASSAPATGESRSLPRPRRRRVAGPRSDPRAPARPGPRRQSRSPPAWVGD